MSRSCSLSLAPLLLLGVSGLAYAEEPPIGILRFEDIQVIEPDPFQVAERLEVGAHLGVLPLDPWVVAASLGLSAGYHLSETTSAELKLTFMRGDTTAEAERLQEFGGLVVDSFTPVFSTWVTGTWAPVYGKFNLAGRGVVDYDLGVFAGPGIFLARRTIYDNVESVEVTARWNQPMGLTVGLRHHVWLNVKGKPTALRLDLGDEMFLADNPDQSSWVKHNAHFTAGLSLFLGGPS